MVAEFMRNSVMNWLNAGQAPNNRAFIEQWLRDDPNNAYTQLYNEWASPYENRLKREQEAARNAAYDQQLAALQQTFQGTLSGMSQQYGQQQADISQQWATQLANIQNQYNTQLNQYQTESQNRLGQLQAEIARLNQPTMTDVNYGYRGVGDDFKQFENQFDSIKGLYNQGTGLLSKFAPDQLGTYGQQFTNLVEGYRGALSNYSNLSQQGWQRYGNPTQATAQEAPARYAEYANYSQQLSQSRQGVLSYLNQLSELGQNAYSMGTNLEGQTRQRRLTERSAWFAGESARQAGMLSARAEQRASRGVQRQRQAVASSSNPYGMLSTQNLTR